MKRVFWLTFVAFFLLIRSIGLSFGEEILTLDQCIKMALQNSNDMKLANIDLDKARANLRTAKGACLPNVSLDIGTPMYSWNQGYQNFYYGTGYRIKYESESYNYNGALVISQPIYFTGGKLKISTNILSLNTSSNLYPSVKEVSSDLIISLEQPLFAGNPYKSGLEKQRLKLESEEIGFNDKRNDVIYKVYEAYYDVVLAENDLETTKELIRHSEILLGNVKEKLELGLISETDALQIELDYANDKVKLSECVLNLLKSKDILKDLIELRSEAGFDVQKTVHFEPPELELKGLLKEAEKNNPEIQRLSIQKKMAKLDLASTKRGRWLKGVLEARYGLRGRAPEWRGSIDRLDKSNQVFSLRLTLPLWDSGVTQANIAAAQADLKKIEIELIAKKKEISREMRYLYLELKNAKDKIDILRKGSELAETNMNMIQEKYELGLVDIDDVAKAKATYKEARANLNKAIRDYNLARLKLEKSTCITI